MSYVSIWKPVNDRIVQASRDTRTEIIGLLLGRLENDTIVIEDSITGEFLGETHRVMLPSSSLAKIADDMINRRIKGSIVGWYHSHTEGGAFLSETDIETQRNLQQFSSLVTAMVVDAKTGSAGFFRVHPQTGKQIRLPEADIMVFEDQTHPVPEGRRARPQLRPTPTIEIRGKPSSPKRSLNVLIASLILVALAISLGVLGLVVFRGMTGAQTLVINSKPVLTATIGSPVLVQAMVNGTVRNVTLHYSAMGASSFTDVPMVSLSAGQYEYSIPGQEVTGNIVYYVGATDTAGNSVRTPQYTIPVAEFAFSTGEFALTVYRNSSISTALGLVNVNGFNSSVSLSASGAPQGLSVTFTPNPAGPSATNVIMNVAADPTVSTGVISLVVSAGYTPPNGSLVTRQVTARITVTDFELHVSPTTLTVRTGSVGTYNVSLTTQQGFTDRIQVSLQGLPQGSSYQFSTGGTMLAIGGSGTTTITLSIRTSLSFPSGTYVLTVTASGGGVIHSQTIQLIVR